MSFIFGGNTGQTYDGIKRQRQVADMLMARNNGAPRDAMHGLNMGLSDVVGSVLNRRADKAEREGRSAFGESLSGVMGGDSSISEIAGLLGNPYASSGQQAVLAQMLQQRMTPEDPMDALNLEKARLEIEQLRNPQAQFEQITGADLGYTDSRASQIFQRDRKSGKVFQVGQLPEGAGLDPIIEELAKRQADVWETYLTQGTVAASNAADFEVLGELIELAPQGPLQGRLAGAFPGVNSAADAFQSIVKRVAPSLRTEGSGSTSDIEYAGMLESLPMLARRPEANRAILELMKAKQQINIERASIVQQVTSGALTPNQARDMLREINSRSIMPDGLRKAMEGLSPADEQPVSTPPPDKPLSEWTDEELAAAIPQTPAPPSEDENAPDPRPEMAVSGDGKQARIALRDFTGPAFDEFMRQWQKFWEGR